MSMSALRSTAGEHARADAIVKDQQLHGVDRSSMSDARWPRDAPVGGLSGNLHSWLVCITSYESNRHAAPAAPSRVKLGLMRRQVS